MNLFDIMRQAGGGNAFSTLASQYGLSEDQMSKAVQAFMPAFSTGLKRSTVDPLGLMEFMRRLATGDYRQAYQDPAWAFGAGLPQGEEALRFLFGSPEAARAVAVQASAFTGLAQQKLAELLPALAAMMFGGLAKQATAVSPAVEAMLKQFQATMPLATEAPKGPLDRYEQEQSNGQGLSEVARAQEEMMKAGLAAFQAGTAVWQQAVGEMMQAGGGMSGAKKRPETKASGGDLFGEMFEPGLRLSEAYQREMEALVERLRPVTRRS